MKTVNRVSLDSLNMQKIGTFFTTLRLDIKNAYVIIPGRHQFCRRRFKFSYVSVRKKVSPKTGMVDPPIPST